MEAGDVEVAGKVLEGTEFSLAVPGYVAEKLGVQSLADLDKYAEEFGRKIYGIEPGAPANSTIQKMIDEDAYGLGDWEMVASGTEAMLANASRAASREEPVVFLGWSPHWMTTEFDLLFLDDPAAVWPGAGEIRSLVRSDLGDTDANLVRFVSQIQVDAVTASEFISAVDKEGRKADEVAQEWMVANPDQLEAWLEGVKSVDGAPAAEMIQGGAGK